MIKNTFGFDKPEDSPGFLLWQTTITWQRKIKNALDPFGISHAQFVILAITLWFESKKQEVSQSLIVRQSRLDKMTVSKSLKKLVEHGLVMREENQKDSRAKCVRLTRTGQMVTARMVSIIEKVDSGFFDSIKKLDQQALLKILQQLVINSENTEP
ncbi:Organic hydroperoxide resistance transcriptional regulator [Aquicella siphonis]|uniref:HTH-type transcriptional regulator SarZ n=1 Tax=Aquicella siphonis TaxID=254247 RepID=A0A5E4PLC0_9COXI|nr:MarR family winged helix-turn-helix transcriptional regulator [Aquicella siphonis]VVC77211.1 Organic hydroperoxide resistance transcriptional regulator [Aquicella siphonis]